MAIGTKMRDANCIKNFDDLKGLRTAGYVRDSTLDQRNGFGPDIQRHNMERFAQLYGLILDDRWYTEFVSGRSVVKRRQFQQILEDAHLDLFDVLLVDHTSRFGRNQAECIHYKEELKLLGKTVIFVSQGIISGSDRDFLCERMNETMDEGSSRNLSRWVSEGLVRKTESGLHAGPPPLGFKSELISGKRERKIQDTATMPALLLALREYATGNCSFRDAADHMNAQGHRTRTGRLFTGYNIRDILGNRFYEGKVIYHSGRADEKVIDGCHEIPEDVRMLWLRCQDVKKSRANNSAGHPREENHVYPFSRILKCRSCGSPYHGEAVYHGSRTDLRLTHERRTNSRNCCIRPRSCSVNQLSQEFSERVLSCIHLNDDWKTLVIAALQGESQKSDSRGQQERITRAMENLRKQHIWGDITDDAYRRERTALDLQLKSTAPKVCPDLPNMERSAQLLNDLHNLVVASKESPMSNARL